MAYYKIINDNEIITKAFKTYSLKKIKDSNDYQLLLTLISNENFITCKLYIDEQRDNLQDMENFLINELDEVLLNKKIFVIKKLYEDKVLIGADKNARSFELIIL